LGDGTISSSTDKQITHQYLTAGLYTPSLILEDSAGCKATSILPEKIIVDSLSAGFSYAPLRICAGTNVAFNGQPASFSTSRLNEALDYKWSVANVHQGSNKDFSYLFGAPGAYEVLYEVSSKYGCNTSARKNITIEAPLNAVISGATSVCKADTASFKANATATGLSWRWVIPGQPSITNAQTPSIQWNTPGVYTLSLLADNGACTDSIVHALTVHDLPAITAGPPNARVCLGDTLDLSVQGNGQNSWQVGPVLLQQGNNLARVWPAQDTWFYVQSLSSAGCGSADSVKVTVVQPFAMQVDREEETCLGKTVNLSASGATSYQWVPAQGLSSSIIGNPVANLQASVVYKVIGRDAFGCFTDTAEVSVTIHPLPVVNAGADVSVQGGQPVNLSATSSLSNVSWNWSPATYLSCTNCASPVSNPLRDISYRVTATSQQGCVSSDSVNITVLCSSESIFIPNAFTPNGDGLNERFGVLGGGFSLIKFFRISDRWGKVVFERRNVLPTDVSAFWTGQYPDGSPAVTGSYIYSIQVECATGLLFDYKGSVSLMR
jgi:gliding motility-associated-like protein